MKTLISLLLYSLVECSQDLDLIAVTRTTFLDKYTSYEDVVLLKLNIPPDSLSASFKFVTGEISMSVFGCSPKNISLYMKYNSLPVINPDGSAFPTSFKNITRSKIYNLEFTRNAEVQYLNFTSPQPGPYYIATFIAYSDPKYNAIEQQGLTPLCYKYVDAFLYINKTRKVNIVIEEEEFSATICLNCKLLYKFFVPKMIDHAIIVINHMKLDEVFDNFTVRVESNSVPTNFSQSKIITSNDILVDNLSLQFFTQENTWHYLEFLLASNENSLNYYNLTFHLRFFSSQTNQTLIDDDNNKTISTVDVKLFNSNYITNTDQYKEYSLAKKASSENFLFSYEFPYELESKIPVTLNLTSNEFTSLKFTVENDIGGTLQAVAVFKPKITKTLFYHKIEKEPENHLVIGCIRNRVRETPIWPNNCEYNNIIKTAPLILNSTISNTSVLIPFPESGLWFVTFKLFCGKCIPCNCSNECQQDYQKCTETCEMNCDSKELCNNCRKSCEETIIERDDCKDCNCNGPCLKNNITTCNTSLIFDIGSYACVSGDCGSNGRCMFFVSNSVIYSSCVCSNNYRGWDCSDSSNANPYWLVVLELLLLVLSNLMFLPTVYFAFKRKYYIESIIYFSICFFSTFYHACDAGENIISFCITRLQALQFADFFCALLAIWVTLIAIADLPLYLPSICHILGAIILAFFTTINKTSLWVFTVPCVIGVIIIIVNWYLKYRKIRQLFINKRYLYVFMPIGLTVVIIGLIIYSLLQTTDNYKYLHSMWHICMAVAVILLLPRPDTFHPDVIIEM